MHKNCKIISKELSGENKICLEIYSIASLSTSEDAFAIYSNYIEPHDIVMNIPVPKCSGEANTPCSIMISELIGSITSKQILRVIFDSVSN